MHYGNIKYCDIANGTGIRISLFVSGCRIHCPGCFNHDSQNFNFGKEFTKETEEEIMQQLHKEYINGLTVLGGEPMEPENQRSILNLIQRIKTEMPNKTIWVYTGYEFETTMPICEVTDKLLSYIDVIVDGPFIMAKKNITLKFRGSENQRIIDVQKTLNERRVWTIDL